jgi:hypothetical protein
MRKMIMRECSQADERPLPVANLSRYLTVTDGARALSCISRTAVVGLFVLASTVLTAAQAQIVALVEEVDSKTAGVEFMDYVSAGKVIRLEGRDTLVISYMKSCLREIINGGTVTVGVEQSDVQLGKVIRQKVDCDGGRLTLSPQQASQSAGMVFRNTLPRQQASALNPQITLYGVSPMVEIKGGGPLTIERIDHPGERFELTVSNKQLVNGMFYDLAQVGKALEPGAIYRARTGARQIIFRIDPDAKPGRSPIVGRLLRVQPTS